MFKKIIYVSLVFPVVAAAGAISTETVKIESIYSYDDHNSGTVYINLTESLPECPVGGYLNRQAAGFKELYSLAIAAMMADKSVVLQLYTDRIDKTRCEIDAVRVYSGS